MMVQKIIITLLLVFGFTFVAQSSVQAIDLFRDTCSGDRGNKQSDGSTVCKDQKEINDNPGIDNNPIYGPNGIITSITNILSAAVAIGAVISITYAGMKLITSGSNPQEANSARERIIYACVALVFVVLAQTIVRFVINRL